MKRMAALALPIIVVAGCASTPVPAVDSTKMSEGYMTQGYAYLEAGKNELALSEFHRSIQENPKNKWAHYYLGVTNDRLGKLKEAEEFYREGVEIDSSFSEAYNALGVVYSKQQKWTEALKNFTKALQNPLYSTRYIPHLNMGDVYMSMKNYSKAIEAYGESKRFEKLDFTILKLGEAYLEAGRVDDAIREFKEASSMSPMNAIARYRLAVAYVKKGSKHLAIAEFKRAVELAPGSEVARMSNDYLKTLR